MVCAFIVKTVREQARVATIGIHLPKSWHSPGLGAAENNMLAVWGFALAQGLSDQLGATPSHESAGVEEAG